MSGGHWSYLSNRLEDAAALPGEALELLAAIEHELDWGVSGDTCYDCARARTIAALEAFFDRASHRDDEANWRDVLAADGPDCSEHATGS